MLCSDDAVLAPGDLAQTVNQVAASACVKHSAGLWDKESDYNWRRQGFRSKHVQLSYCRTMCCAARQTINICLSKDTQQILLPCICRYHQNKHINRAKLVSPLHMQSTCRPQGRFLLTKC